MPQTFVVDLLAPIPVGHRVRVDQVEHREAGTWVATRDFLVRDEETGVEYVPSRCNSKWPDNDWYDKDLYIEELGRDWRRGASVVGRVVQCRVACAGRHAGYVTRLLVEPEGPQPYR